jgi:hypothetical protein
MARQDASGEMAVAPRAGANGASQARHGAQDGYGSAGDILGSSAWDKGFFDPIIFPDGRKLLTLRDAATYSSICGKRDADARPDFGPSKWAFDECNGPRRSMIQSSCRAVPSFAFVWCLRGSQLATLFALAQRAPQRIVDKGCLNPLVPETGVWEGASCQAPHQAYWDSCRKTGPRRDALENGPRKCPAGRSEELLRKARQTDIASHMNEWLSSSRPQSLKQ